MRPTNEPRGGVAVVPDCHSELSDHICLCDNYQRNISISPGAGPISSPHLGPAPPSASQVKIFCLRRKIVESQHGSQLVISLAESVDTGEYSCQVSALDKSVLTHHVNVRGENCEEELDRNNVLGLSLFYSVLFVRTGKQSQHSVLCTAAKNTCLG